MSQVGDQIWKFDYRSVGDGTGALVDSSHDFDSNSVLNSRFDGSWRLAHMQVPVETQSLE